MIESFHNIIRTQLSINISRKLPGFEKTDVDGNLFALQKLPFLMYFCFCIGNIFFALFSSSCSDQ